MQTLQLHIYIPLMRVGSQNYRLPEVADALTTVTSCKTSTRKSELFSDRCSTVSLYFTLLYFFLKGWVKKNTLNEIFSRSLLMESWEVWKHFQIWLFKGPICKKVVIWVSFKNGCFALAADLTGVRMRLEVTLKINFLTNWTFNKASKQTALF